jgi:hypothetical protein
LGGLVTSYAHRAEPEVVEEVVECGDVGVDGVGRSLAHGLEVGLVVADGEVAAVGVGERVAAVDVGLIQPGEEAAHAGAVGASGVGVQWCAIQRRGVGLVHGRETLGHLLASSRHRLSS